MKAFLSILFAIFFLITGALSVLMSSLPGSDISKNALPFLNVIYSWHLACWMVLGMMANYLWDLFRSNKGIQDISLPAILLPILVSPIVFFAVWSLVGKNIDGIANIDLVWALVSFQNGFFWQVVFSKAGAGIASPPTAPTI